MSTPWSFTISTGNPATDQQELLRCQQSYQAQGMQVHVQPLPTGGYQVTVAPAGAAAAPAQPVGQNLAGTLIMNATPQAQPFGNAPGAPPGAGYGAPPGAGSYGNPPGAGSYGNPPGAPPGAAGYGTAPSYGAAPGLPAAGYPGQPPAAQQGYGTPQQNYGGQQSYGAPQAPAGQAYGGSAPAYGAAAAAAVGSAFGSGAQPPAAQPSYAASSNPAYGGQAPAYAQGAPAYAMAGGGGAAAASSGGIAGESAINRAAEAVGAPPISSTRLAYLRKVYGLLSGAAFLAVFAGWASVSLGPVVDMVSPDGIPAQVPYLVSLMLADETLMYAAFGVLFLATIGASWVSKVPVLNVTALMGVAALMGVQLAPMVFVAQFYAGVGDTMSSAPVRDAMIMVLSVFVGITGYVFVTRKDFSWMGSILSMGFFVVFAGCILTFVFDSEPFALAVASVGALFAIGMLLYVTSYIFRNSEMDDPVGDALALLVQLRNLFMFLLRIFMSRR